EQLRRAFAITSREVVTHGRAAHTFAVEQKAPDGLHGVTTFGANAFEQGEVAPTLTPEAKIIPHHERAHAEATCEIVARELLGTLLTQGDVEFHAQHGIET